NCELLASSLAPVLDVGDDFVAWAALVTPTEQLRRLVARRTAAASSDEIVALVADARISLSRAHRPLRVLRDMPFHGDPGGSVSAARVLTDLRTIVANYMSMRAEFQLEICGDCIVKVPRHVLTGLFVWLLADALSALRSANREPGRI